MLHGFQGEHLCSVVDGSASLLEQAIPYLLDGLANGERCIHVAADHTPEQIEKALEERNIDVRQAVASGDLLLWTPQQYRQPGVFCERRMKEFILSVLNEALVQQYRGIRLAVEMAWANNCGVDDDALVRWESLLNEVSYPGSRISFICQYNVACLSPVLVRRCLGAHPGVAIEDRVYSNACYLPFRGTDSPTVNTSLQSLLDEFKRSCEPRSLVRRVSGLTRLVNDALPRSQDTGLNTLGRLMMTLAHELATPICNIDLMAGNLLDRLAVNPTLEEVETHIEKILRQAKRANVLLQHLRTFGRQALAGTRYKPIAINTIITGAIALLEERIRSNEVEVVLDLSPKEPVVVGDPIQLEQVFINVIINACDAMDGRPMRRVRVGTLVIGEKVRITVQDTGEGIPEALIMELGKPFVTTKPAGKGNGLGLSIASDILSAHRGTLDVYSRIDQGTTFVMTLPLNADPTQNTKEVRP
ncbi:MAG: hypothetical protein C4293_06055 [Nitrospiraceae bacterium]